MPRLVVLLSMLLALNVGLVTTGGALAQEASPAAGPCDAPKLPPGTPSAMPEGTPAAADGIEAMATPAAEAAPAEETEPTQLAGTPISGAEAEEAGAAVENLANCINAGDYLAVAALLTDNFIQNFIEVPTAYDVPATFEGVQPIATRSIGQVQTYDDGRVSVDWIYTGLFNGPGGLASERFFFVKENGYYKLDALRGAPLPEGALPGATVVDVQLVDYAFALSTSKIPAGPVIFRTTNTSASGSFHENVLLTYPEGTTAEALIQGKVDIDNASTGFLGAISVEPGESADLAFENLAAGTYFLLCGVPTEDGTPHFKLGMVAQITVE